ncbi:Crp/Fnr family transcriptional regulator [Roseospira goensis]|uniref:CRP-like cAMP-binding protein n=1 Tax=Roseospira goensis TaxID=391922 RepID=A0A7W6S1M4_9PROT|nr:Crp/Fnr family transcriptional regulator [Roseospira goensis]MBB4287077.1 CRP-like cAMP-binding protein [Roseospira goensis]
MGTDGAGPDRVATAPPRASRILDRPSRPESGEEASLGGNILLGNLPPPVLKQVEDACRWRQLATDDVVFDQDDPSRDVYFIVRGKLRILVFRGPQDPEAEAESGGQPSNGTGPGGSTGTGSATSDVDAETESIKAGNLAFEALVDEGVPMTLTELGAGDTFGELSAIDGRMRSARAVALEPSLVAILDGEAFVALVRDHGDLALALLRRVAGYLRASNRRMYNLSTLTAKQRVYAQLARLAEVNARRPAEWIIEPLPSHADIAFWAGTKRETVAAAIGWLAREGVVVRQHRALLIRDPNRLKALAHV